MQLNLKFSPSFILMMENKSMRLFAQKKLVLAQLEIKSNDN